MMRRPKPVNQSKTAIGKRKAILERIRRFEQAIVKAKQYLEIGEHAHWHGFRLLFKQKTQGGESFPRRRSPRKLEPFPSRRSRSLATPIERPAMETPKKTLSELPTAASGECAASQIRLRLFGTHALREDLAAARKDSSTSSKPPSSDIVKPKPALEDGAKRSIGGQPGHPKHERQPFPAEQITHFEEHALEVCPCCGGPVHRNADLARIVQQVDVEKPPLTIEQHTFPAEYWCPRKAASRSERRCRRTSLTAAWSARN